MKISVKTLAVSILVTCSGIAEVSAQDMTDLSQRPLVDVDGRFRVIGQTDDDGDPNCIGDLSTPLCVVETVVAADARWDWNLKKIAYGLIDPKDRKPFSPESVSKTGYRITSVRRFGFYNIPTPEMNAYGIQPGDVAVFIEVCNATYNRCTEPDLTSNYGYLLRKDTNGWHAMPELGLFHTDLTDPRLYYTAKIHSTLPPYPPEAMEEWIDSRRAGQSSRNTPPTGQ